MNAVSSQPMRFATRQNLGLNRPPAIWFIKRFLDPTAEISFFPPDQVVAQAQRIGAVPFHTPGVELHVDKELRRTTLDAFLMKYGWKGRDPALDMLAEIVNDASFRLTSGDVRHPEAFGLKALHLGLRETKPVDAERLAVMFVVCDALYAHCKARIAQAHASP